MIPAVAKAAAERRIALDRRGRVKMDLKDSLTVVLGEDEDDEDKKKDGEARSKVKEEELEVLRGYRVETGARPSRKVFMKTEWATSGS